MSACDCGVRCGPRTPAGPVGAGAARRKSVSAHTPLVPRRVGGDARRQAPPAQSARAASPPPARTDGTRREESLHPISCCAVFPLRTVWRWRRRRRPGRTSVARSAASRLACAPDSGGDDGGALEAARSSQRVKMRPQADHLATALRPGTEGKRGPRICGRRRIFSAPTSGPARVITLSGRRTSSRGLRHSLSMTSQRPTSKTA